MKQIPILFSTPMVQAILLGRKTMTRRIVKIDDLIAEPYLFRYIGNSEEKEVPRAAIKFDDRIWYEWQLTNSNASSWVERCKWKSGDLLWVRESWQLKGWSFEDGLMTIKYATGETFECFAPDPNEDSSWLLNKVEQLESKGYIKSDSVNDEIFVFTDKKQPFKPSIHMPKEAARIWLRVTDIHVERLKDISEEDAIVEGIGIKEGESFKYFNPLLPNTYFKDARSAFFSLWESINGKESLDSNPWIWVVSFKVLSTTGKRELLNH